MRKYVLVIVALAWPAGADAQIIRQRFPPGQPSAWVSVGAALQSSWSVRDGSTGSTWDFGSSTQYAASIEKSLSNGATVGIRGTTAMVPLVYTSGSLQTEADANVSQAFASLHIASGREFHSVLELSAGATLYSNFRARGTGSKLAPDAPDADFTFAFGYGFGYSFSPSFSMDVVQDISTVVHQKTGLSASDDSSVRVNGTRIVARVGLGGR